MSVQLPLSQVQVVARVSALEFPLAGEGQYQPQLKVFRCMDAYINDR
jgi:hypothetical protein